MINSQKVAYSKGKNDECYTPEYGVEPILKYIPEGCVVWCPFDTPQSKYVQLISEKNDVIFSHLGMGQDFYTYEPSQHWDMIISNPPFSGKRKIFERALSFNKPFALLMNINWLNDKYSKWVFKEANRQMQLLMFDKRIHYNGLNKITFSSSYFCCDLLPKDIMIEELHIPKNN